MEPFVPHGASIETQFLFWAGTGGVILLIGVVGYFWVENGRLKKERENEVVNAIKESINNLSTTITSATEEFKNALSETSKRFERSAEEMWEHIGELRENVSWLTGQHEANHKISYEGPERRIKPRHKGDQHD